MKTKLILYWIFTGLLSVLMLFSAAMYFFDYENVSIAMEGFGYPTYLIYPLACLKLSGIAVILIGKGTALKQWAYAGFFFNFVLAFFAHYMISDGEQAGALLALVLLLSSYFLGKTQRP